MTNETKWSIDHSHCEIAFKVKHLMIAFVKGSFKTFDANIYTIGKDFSTAEIELWIDASTIYTGDKTRDKHLMDTDFLNIKKHKQITFKSSSIACSTHPEHELLGELTMAGITKNVNLKVHFGGIVFDHMRNEKAGFTISGKINRKDWGLVWNSIIEAGGMLVGEVIDISCEIELINTSKVAVHLPSTAFGAGKAIL